MTQQEDSELLRFQQARSSLLQAAMSMSPDIRTEQAFMSLVHDTQKVWSGDSRYREEVLLALLGGMSDGLRYGNWPGTTYTKVEITEG